MRKTTEDSIMYSFIKKNMTSPIEVSDIMEIEKRFDITFPHILKEFYLLYNGCETYLCSFCVDGREYEVLHFLSIRTGKESMEEQKEDEILDGIVPNSLIPFAYDRGGDYLYWENGTENIFMIYPDDIENPSFICQGMERFFSLLESGTMR